MQKLGFGAVQPLLREHGRILYDEKNDIGCFNWTCSGFTITFTGTVLLAELVASPTRALMTEEELYDHPWVAVFVDGAEEPAQRFALRQGRESYTLFEGQPGTHSLRLVKLSENSRGFAGLAALETDGAFSATPMPQPPLRLEFVGDSITCGFGNGTTDRDAPFLTTEEDGWNTYGAKAARELGAEASFVCLSGISVSRDRYPPFEPPIPGMRALYPYTDRIHQHVMDGRRDGFAPWDFAAHPVDAVVLNLGTNDVNALKFTQDPEKQAEELAFFQREYLGLVREIRALNGPDTLILCTLGPLDYYLYDEIRDIVAGYAAETGDERVACFKFGGVNMMLEGFGAAAHPSAKTHSRMADELVAQIRRLVPCPQ